MVGYESRTNSYDLADCLIHSNATGSHSHNSNELFRYDVLDNLTQKVRNGQTINLNVNSRNRLATAKSGTATIASYGYDARGNITARGGFRHSYDLMNRMTSTHAPFYEVYRYDGHNRRTDIIRNGKHHYSMYDLSGKLVYSFDTNSRKCIEYIHLGGRLVAESERTNCGGARRTTYQHLNYLGTPILTSKPNGQINQAESLTPYGQPYSNNWVKGIGFTGHTTDAQTRLTYMQQRYMDGFGGRFLSVDPITPSTYDGSNFNRYWYANNNPYKYVDPDGRETIVMVNDNTFLLGTHSGLIIKRDEEYIIYDPSGSFKAQERGSAGLILGSHQDYLDYIKFQKDDGPDIHLFKFETSEDEEKKIINEAENIGDPRGMRCTTSVVSALKSLERFKDLKVVRRPRSLLNQMKERAQKKSEEQKKKEKSQEKERQAK